MKSLIIHFSQTGNTEKVAQSIRNGIIKGVGQCDLKTLAQVDKNSLAEYDLVGLGCPVFYYQPPFHVRDFMESLPPLDGKQWFVFCTHGSVMGMTLVLMSEALSNKGITVVGHHHTYADGTLPFYPHPTYTTGHPDAADIEEAFSFGKEVAERSQQIAGGDIGLVPVPEPVPEEWVGQEVGMFSPETLSQIMPRMHIDPDRCTGCNECADSCPVNGIDVDADPPRIQDPCIFCWHCANICPSLAIQADWEVIVSMAPANYERYREALEGAAARGEFRWLMDPDSLDFNDPFYRQRERQIKEPKPGG